MTVRRRVRLSFGVLCALTLSGAAAYAFRPHNKAPGARAAWMSISSQKTGQDYYLDAAEDGAVTVRNATKTSIVTRRGKIAQRLAKDLFREIDSSDLISAQGAMASKLVFYKGETLKISAYVSGELKVVNAPLDNYGEAFAYAFNEVKKAAGRLPADEKLRGFLVAEQITGMELEEYRLNASRTGETKDMETYDILKTPDLLKSVKQPLRLIPLESEADMKMIQDFITTRRLYGLMKLFYLPSTRGTFKCRVLDASGRR